MDRIIGGSSSSVNRSVGTTLDEVENRLLKVRQTLQDLLVLLELQTQVPWEEMVQLFCTLSNQYSSLQATIKASDLGKVLAVPNHIQLEPDTELMQLTEGRIGSWNHETLPQYLSIALTQEAELEDSGTIGGVKKPSILAQIESEVNAGGKQADYWTKQIKSFNTHIDTISASLSRRQISLENSLTMSSQMPTMSSIVDSETTKMVNAILLGRGIVVEPQRGPQNASLSYSGPGSNAGGSVGPSSDVRTVTPQQSQQQMKK